MDGLVPLENERSVPSEGLEKARAAEIYSRTLSLIENDLHNLLKVKSAFDKQVIQLRNNIRDSLAQLLFLDYEFCSNQDVEQTLWKVSFYKIIEEYRKRLRKYAAANRANTPEVQPPKQQEELQKISSSFRGFLASSSQFYLSLLDNLKEKYGDDDIRGLVSRHRCYIFLGDLARYHKDLVGLEKEGSISQELSQAEAYYKLAAGLLPINGNPHNQIAVLATYRDDELGAVYSYCRSLAVKHPFTAARENLILLFEKNRIKVQEIKKVGKGNKNQGNQLRDFLAKFLRLHGMIFTRTGLEAFNVVLSDVLRDLTRHILRHAGDPIILRLFAINIFSVFNVIEGGLGSHPVNGSPQTKNGGESSFEKKALLSYAFWLAIEFFNTVACKGFKVDKPRFLGPIAIFLDWLKCNPDFLSKPTLDATEMEVKAWEVIRSGVVWVLNVVLKIDSESNSNESDSSESDDERDEGTLVLPEEIELRGFLPLQHYLITVPFNASHAQPIDGTNIARQKKYFKRRLEKVKSFARFAIEVPELLSFDVTENVFTTVLNQHTTSSPRIVDALFFDSSNNDAQATETNAPVNHSPRYDFVSTPEELNEENTSTVPAHNMSSTSHTGTGSSNNDDDDLNDEVILFTPQTAANEVKPSLEEGKKKAPIGFGRKIHPDEPVPVLSSLHAVTPITHTSPRSSTPPNNDGGLWLSPTITSTLSNERSSPDSFQGYLSSSPTTPSEPDNLSSLFSSFSFNSPPTLSTTHGLPSIWSNVTSPNTNEITDEHNSVSAIWSNNNNNNNSNNNNNNNNTSTRVPQIAHTAGTNSYWWKELMNNNNGNNNNNNNTDHTASFLSDYSNTPYPFTTTSTNQITSQPGSLPSSVPMSYVHPWSTPFYQNLGANNNNNNNNNNNHNNHNNGNHSNNGTTPNALSFGGVDGNKMGLYSHSNNPAIPNTQYATSSSASVIHPSPYISEEQRALLVYHQLLNFQQQNPNAQQPIPIGQINQIPFSQYTKYPQTTEGTQSHPSQNYPSSNMYPGTT